ncbi:MAG: transposase [Oligoflexales bacterium]
MEIVYLPPYSPNLNPIERLWKLYKKKVLANTFHENVAEFRSATTNFFGEFENTTMILQHF